MRRKKRLVFLLAVLGAVIVSADLQAAGQGESTRRQANRVNSTTAAAQADRLRYMAQIQSVESLLPRLADRGAALFLLASRYARLGNSQKALRLLKECVALDEGHDPADVAAFESLRSSREFQQLVDKSRQRHPPVHRARIAYTVAEADLFPEGLAVDPEKHVFYMGSMHRRKIVQITEDGHVSEFVKAGLYDLMPIGGVKVDAVGHSVWAASDPGEKNRSELLHFDKDGKLLERYVAPGEGAHDLNDLVLRNAREIYVTDSSANQVFRFDRDSHTFTSLSFPRPLFVPNGITVSGDRRLLYVADSLGVQVVDLRDNSVREVIPAQGTTLESIDGLYWYKNDLIGVQYMGSRRVVRWQLAADGYHATSGEVLESRSRLVKFPTTGAIYKDKFYFIANTGIANLNDDKIIDPAKLEPVNIAVVDLK